MVKLLIVYNKIWPYREEIFDIINKHFDLTVAFTDSQFVNKSYSFKTIYTPGKWIGPFYLHDKPLNSLCSGYDAVLALNEIRCLSIMRLGFYFKRKYSLTYWGIGVSASYSNKFDASQKWDRLRTFLADKAESIVFYSAYPIEKYINLGINRNKLFVAHNTSSVKNDLNFDVIKKELLFVGTLYKQKGIDLLLNAYKSLYERFLDKTPQLNIVGDGPERENIQQWIDNNNLNKNIVLHGAIYDVEKLKYLYDKSLACISPNQAGLSVLTSMGYATAFVTEKNAITGGEIFNIENMVNGIIYEGGEDQLREKLVWIINNQETVIEMGRRAKEHYDQFRTPQLMANSLIEAVEYAIKMKNGRN